MKKTIILSLTLALAGGMAGLIHDVQTQNHNLSMAEFSKSTMAIEPENTSENANDDYTISSDDYSVRKNNTPNKRNINNTNNNTTNSNSITNDNQSTSPYGINNANRGVLPNNTKNNTQNNNVDSMVRTNNIDTYKNNTVTNMDGRVYDSNGVLIHDNTNRSLDTNSTNRVDDPTFENTNQPTPTPSKTSTINNSQNAISTDNSQPQTIDTNKIDSSDNKSNNTNTTNISRQPNTTRSLDSTMDTQISTKITKSDDLSINNRLSELNQSMNEKMETARENIARVLDQSITLDDAKVTLLNAYSRVIHCLDIKLAQNHFDLMRSAGNLAVIQSEQGTKVNVEPYNLEMQYILHIREVCLEYLIEALDNLNNLFDGIENKDSSIDTKTIRSSVISTSAIPQTKEYTTTNPNPSHSAHTPPRA